MTMIPWLSVLFNGFWILGAAVLLAAFSYEYWWAGQEGLNLGEVLRRRRFRQFFWLALFLISVGLAGTSDEAWELIVWIAFCGYCLVSIYQLRRMEE